MIPPGYPPMPPYYPGPGGAPYPPPPHMQPPPGYNPHLHPMFQHPPQPIPSQHLPPAPRPLSSVAPVPDIKGGDPGYHDMSNPRVCLLTSRNASILDMCSRRLQRVLVLLQISCKTSSLDPSLSTRKISPLVPMGSYPDVTPMRHHSNMILISGYLSPWAVTTSFRLPMPPLLLRSPCQSPCQKIVNWFDIL